MSDLLKISSASYQRFLHGLPELVRERFPRRLPVGKGADLDVRVERVHLLNPEWPEADCLEQGLPYRHRLLIDLRVDGELKEGVLLGWIPALTSRGTLLYGAPARERVAVFQLRLPWEKRLARRLQREKKKAVKALRQNDEAIRAHLQETWEEAVKRLRRRTKRKAEPKVPSVDELLKQDTSPDLRDYKLRELGDLLTQAVEQALGRIRGQFGRLRSDDEVETFFFPALPAVFTELVESYLNRTGLIHLLDKTNPLAEVAHKRKVTFCGRGGIQNLEGDEERIPERGIHPSQYGCLCPVETPESDKVGLNLHPAVGASLDLEARQLRAGKEILGVSAALIPFIAHNDPNRALMGAKNMKQALPLLKPEVPLIQTGWEARVARDSRLCLVAERDGEVLGYREGRDGAAEELIVHYKGEAQPRTYHPAKVPGALEGIGSFYRPIESRVGRTPLRGKVEEVRERKVILKIRLGEAAFTEEISIPEGFLAVVEPGQKVEPGQVVAFRRAFEKGEVLLDASATVDGVLALGVNLLVAYMPWYGYNFEDALVISERLVREDVLTSLHLFVEEEEGPPKLFGQKRIKRRRVQVGDKLCNRHGHKGVVARIEPEGNMPIVLGSDGEPLRDEEGRELRVDLLVNPHSVISRMNLGQLYETHWSWVAWKQGQKQKKSLIVVPPFSRDYGWDALQKRLEELSIDWLQNGKAKVRWRNPFTQEERQAEVVVGWQYWMKVNHLAGDKLHVRARGQRTLITKQPVKGKKRGGGQRVGEMEVWALQALAAEENLREILTVKSDASVEGSGVIKDHLPLPEALRAFLYHLRGLGIEVRLIVRTDRGKEEPFPLEDTQAPLDFERVVRAEASWADEECIRGWARKGRGKGAPRRIKVTSPDLYAFWCRCPSCGHADWVETFAQGKKGPRKCPNCEEGRIEVRVRWHPEGLFSEAIFGEDPSLHGKEGENPQRRALMGYIELREPVSHPLELKRKVRLIPVIPPAYRPLLPGGRGEGLNRWYRRILVCNAMLASQKTSEGKEAWRKELIRAVAGLYGKRAVWEKKLQFRNDDDPRHDNLRRRLEGKKGLVRGHILGKRVDFSGRAVIVPDPQLPFGTCRLPRKAAVEFFEALAGPLESLKKEAQRARLNRWWSGRPVLLNRAPTLHRYNFLAFLPDPKQPFWEEAALAIHPLICGMYNADFDGDTMAFHLPLSEEAQREARERLLPQHHLFSIAHGGQLLHLAQDIVSGIYLLTDTEQGRQQLAKLLDLKGDPFPKSPLTKKDLQGVIEEFLREQPASAKQLEEEALAQLDGLMREAFRTVTEQGLSFSIGDLQALMVDRDERSGLAGEVRCEEGEPARWSQRLRKRIGGKLKGEMDKHPQHLKNPVAILVGSGARGDAEQLARLCGAALCLEPFSNYVEGLTEREYFEAAGEARPDIVRKKIGPALGGDLTRKLVHGLYPVRIVRDVCGDAQGLELPFKVALEKEGGEEKEELLLQLVGRHVAEAIDGVIKKGEAITEEVERRLREERRTVRVFSPITCQAEGGICARCYGADPSTRQPPELGLPVGLLAAQSIGERATQDFMRAFHGVRPKILENIEAAKAFFERGELPFIPQSHAKDPSEVAGEWVGWLYAAYEGKVDPRHFEVVLRQMEVKVKGDDIYGLPQITRERLSESFLSVVAFREVTRQALEAAQQCLQDRLELDPAPLFLGVGYRVGAPLKTERRKGEGKGKGKGKEEEDGAAACSAA